MVSSRRTPKEPGRRALYLAGLAAAALALAAALLAWRRDPRQAPASGSGASELTLVESRPGEPAPSARFTPEGRRSGHESSFYVLGRVENTSPFPIDKPRVVVALLDAGGRTLETREGYAERDLLAPGEVSAVKIFVHDPPAHSELRYSVVAHRALFDPGRVEGLEVELDGPARPNFGTWDVSGKVRNPGQRTAHGLKIELVFRNARGRVLGVESAFPDDRSVDPGKTSDFRVTVMLDEKPEKIVAVATARRTP